MAAADPSVFAVVHPVVLDEKFAIRAGFVRHIIYNENGDNMSIKRLKSLREDEDLKQQEVADALNITRSAYSNYENEIREIPLDLLIKLANFYQTSVDYLVGLTDIKTPYPHKKQGRV